MLHTYRIKVSDMYKNLHMHTPEDVLCEGHDAARAVPGVRVLLQVIEAISIRLKDATWKFDRSNGLIWLLILFQWVSLHIIRKGGPRCRALHLNAQSSKEIPSPATM